jgi:hypothetical protein
MSELFLRPTLPVICARLQYQSFAVIVPAILESDLLVTGNLREAVSIMQR